MNPSVDTEVSVRAERTGDGGEKGQFHHENLPIGKGSVAVIRFIGRLRAETQTVSGRHTPELI